MITCPVCPDLPKTVSWWNFIKKLRLKNKAKISSFTPMIISNPDDDGICNYKCKICYYGYRA